MPSLQNDQSLIHRLQRIVNASSTPEALRDAYILARDVRMLDLFSANEDLQEVNPRHLPFLILPFVLAGLENDAPGPMESRLEKVNRAQELIESFLRSLKQYSVPFERQEVPSDATAKREAKINAYRKEKEIKSRLQVCDLDVRDLRD